MIHILVVEDDQKLSRIVYTYRTIPVLFMTSKNGLPSKQKGFQPGSDDYMVKLIVTVRGLGYKAVLR